MKKYLAVLPLAALAFAAACSDSPMEPTAFQPMLPVGGPSFHLDEDGIGNNNHNDLKPTIAASAATMEGQTFEPGVNVRIAWDGNTGTLSSVARRTGYRYELTCTGTGCTSVSATDVPLSTTRFYVSNLTPGVYVARVRGLGGQHATSNNHGSMWVTLSFSVGKSGPENQTVTFDASVAPTGVTYGGGHVDISNWASASSPITYSSESLSVCEVSGVEVAIVSAGTCIVKASAVANDFFNADDETSSFVIAKKELTVTADSPSKTYDGAAFSPFTVSYNGFVYNQDASALGGTLAFEGDAVGAVNAGEYTITPKGLTSGNYEIEFANGTLTINRAAGSVSINNIPTSAFFGGSFMPTLETLGDGVASLISTTTNVCTVNATTGAVSFDKAGTCRLQASVAQGTNHLAATGAESFTITGFGHANRFEQPINSPLHNELISSFKVGSTIPVKFKISLNGQPVTTGIHTISVKKLATENTQASEETALSTAADQGNTFRYDGEQWIFNLSTKGWAASTKYAITATLADGQTITVDVLTRK